MTLEEALESHLRADSNLAALVGTRILPVQWEQGTAFPLVTYVKISNLEGYSHDGWDGTGSVRMQITSWADGDYPAAINLAEAVKASMRTFDRTARMVIERNTVEPQTNYQQFIQDWMFIWTGTVSPRQI